MNENPSFNVDLEKQFREVGMLRVGGFQMFWISERESEGETFTRKSSFQFSKMDSSFHK